MVTARQLWLMRSSANIVVVKVAVLREIHLHLRTHGTVVVRMVRLKGLHAWILVAAVRSNLLHWLTREMYLLLHGC